MSRAFQRALGCRLHPKRTVWHAAHRSHHTHAPPHARRSHPKPNRPPVSMRVLRWPSVSADVLSARREQPHRNTRPWPDDLGALASHTRVTTHLHSLVTSLCSAGTSVPEGLTTEGARPVLMSLALQALAQCIRHGMCCAPLLTCTSTCYRRKCRLSRLCRRCSCQRSAGSGRRL